MIEASMRPWKKSHLRLRLLKVSFYAWIIQVVHRQQCIDHRIDTLERERSRAKELGPGNAASANMRVNILKFQKIDNFKALFLESDDLALCRAELRNAGFSMDLSDTSVYPLSLGLVVLRDYFSNP